MIACYGKGFEADPSMADESQEGRLTVDLDKLPRTFQLLRDPAVDDASNVLFPLPRAVYLDQTKLPYETTFVTTSDWRELVSAIKKLQVRGAPVIGIVGAAAVALVAAELSLLCLPESRLTSSQRFWREEAIDKHGHGVCSSLSQFWNRLNEASRDIASARPTAVNLTWAVKRAIDAAWNGRDPKNSDVATASASVADALFDFVQELMREDEACNRAIGKAGARLLRPHSRILTHCNAGSLATSFYGTALGVVYSAAQQGKIERVYADETRPVGQGARLTTWELAQVGIPVTLICDNMAASLMASGKVDAVIVGADRITANGDVANKIGTYGVAVLARFHKIPFYVAAPSSTIDLSLPVGAHIPIEQRSRSEVLPKRIEGVDVWNPAFDVTPASLVTGIITEGGVFDPGDLVAAFRGKPFKSKK